MLNVAVNTKNYIPIERIRAFQNKILDWWNTNRKEYPWSSSNDPYHILVSEFMLQQTQASRVIPKYLDFIKTFPTLESLATASKLDIFRLWSGLGYNRRALWLQETAKELIHMNQFPRNPKELLKFKGIGSYTSRSILIFAFNLDLATVDVNIRRVLIHEGFATEESTEKHLFAIAQLLVPKGKSKEYHSGLMAYGSMVLTASKTGIRSKSRQGKFKGSNREFRGKIIKFLTKNLSATLETISQKCDLPVEKAHQLLIVMVKEGLVENIGDFYSIDGTAAKNNNQL